MKKLRIFILVSVIMLSGYNWSIQSGLMSIAPAVAGPASSTGSTVPAKGMVTMVDLGADKCVPCKLMAPILKELEREYRGRAAIVFLDVWKNPAPGRKFRIRVIPTQIFFDAAGKEVYRHEGFMAREDIVFVLQQMGVK